MEESFFVLDGEFRFTVGADEVHAGPGTYLLVPRATRHVLAAGPGGGRCLILMVPGGHEDMFFELAGLGPDALRDPVVRAEIAGRYDSVPT
jgi:quercetin dioxygenase-like cupin family protein